MSLDGRDHPSGGGVDNSRGESTIPGHSERPANKTQPETSFKAKKQPLPVEQQHERLTNDKTLPSNCDSSLSPPPADDTTSNYSDGHQLSETKTDESSGINEARAPRRNVARKAVGSIAPKSEGQQRKLRTTANSIKTSKTVLPEQSQSNGTVTENPCDGIKTIITDPDAKFMDCIKYVKHEHKAAKNETRRLKERLSKLEEAKAEKDAEYTLLNTSFQEMQKSAMNRLTKDCSNTVPDDIIEGEFYDFAGRYRAWCDKYSRPSVESWSGIATAVKKMLAANGGVDNWKSQECMEFVKNGHLTIRTILTTALMRLAFANIMEDPFYWIGPRADKARNKNQALGFQWIEDQLCLVSNEEAARWRSLTVQMVSPTQNSKLAIRKNELVGSVFEKKTKRYQQSATRVVEACNALLQPLGERDAIRRQEELVDLCRFLGEIMSGVYAQNLRIQVLFSKEHFFKLGETRFSTHSKLMCAHRSVELGEDTNGESSRRVDLLVQPAIIAYNSGRSGPKDGYRVWLQAIVWMGPDGGQNAHTVCHTAASKKAGQFKGINFQEHHHHPSRRLESAGKALDQGSVEAISDPRKSATEEATGASSAPNLLASGLGGKRRYNEDFSGQAATSKKPRLFGQETAEAQISSPSTQGGSGGEAISLLD